MKNRYTKYMLRLLLLVISIASVIGMGYYYYQYREVTGKNNEATTKKLVKKISKFMVLPAGLPTLATVTDKTKLNTQPFFKNAENGDKVLIYPEAQKVILYRPTKKKIIEVANASTAVGANEQEALNTQQNNSNTPVPTAMTYSVAIYNGTLTNGLTKTVEGNLNGKVSNINIGLKSAASKTDYTETKVVDVSGRSSSKALEIATAVGGKVEPLPAGENKPDADILIIIGEKK